MSDSYSEAKPPIRRRGRGKSVTKAEIEAARIRIRDAAAAGDLQACAALVALAEHRPTQQDTAA